jgi:excisionase family DNA binding protein
VACVRYIDGQEYATVSEVAAAAGVSPQTVRLWERTGRVPSRRTPGGHRLFDADAVKAAVDHAAQSRRQGRARPTPYPVQPGIRAADFASTGARIRAARKQRRLSQGDVATDAGISRSLLSAVERGESGVSVQVFNRIAQALNLPMSDLAPISADKQSVMKAAERPKTVMANGVTWEELASSGHSMAPALLVVASGGSSGGMVTLPRENFVTVIAGELTFEIAPQPDLCVLSAGDSIVLKPGQAHHWRNSGRAHARAIWVEQLNG